MRSTRPFDLQRLRTDAAQRRERAVQDVVASSNWRVVSIPTMLCGSSTTQTTCPSRFGLRQYWHSSLSLMLLQRLHRPSLSLTSRIACDRCSASSRQVAQHVKGHPLRGLLADAGQALEFVDEPRERFGEIGHRLEEAGRKAHAAEHAAHLLLDLVLDLS